MLRSVRFPCPVFSIHWKGAATHRIDNGCVQTTSPNWIFVISRLYPNWVQEVWKAEKTNEMGFLQIDRNHIWMRFQIQFILYFYTVSVRTLISEYQTVFCVTCTATQNADVYRIHAAAEQNRWCFYQTSKQDNTENSSLWSHTEINSLLFDLTRDCLESRWLIVPPCQKAACTACPVYANIFGSLNTEHD